MDNPQDPPGWHGQEKAGPQRLLFWIVVISMSAVALAVGLSAFFYYLLLRPSGPVVAGTISQLTDIGKMSLAVVAGIGGVVALVISFKRQRLSEIGHEHDRQRILNERFTSAVAQLGDSSSASVRIGGVYSLAKLADDWPSDRQRCIDVLCGYLRFPSLQPEQSAHEVEVRRTLSSVIQEHLKEDAPVYWGGNTFNLRGASLDDLSLAEIVLDGGILILAECKMTAGKSDLSGISLESGTIDATGLTMTGGTIDLQNAKIKGGRLLFGKACLNGGNLTLTGSMASNGRICFDGAKIDGGELGLSGMYIWCPDAQFPYDVRISLDKLEIVDGLLDLRYSGLRVADTGLSKPAENDDNDYIVLKMDEATMTGGRISLSGIDLTFGVHSFRRLLASGGIFDCTDTKIHKRAQIQLEGLEMQGGSIDFSHAWIGSSSYEETPDIGYLWVRRLKESDHVESRDVVYRNRHPPGHIDISGSRVKGGLVKFDRSELKGAVVLLYGLRMTGGQIVFERCICTDAVVSLWNVTLEKDAVIDFGRDFFESPVIIHSRYSGGLGTHVRLHEYSCLLEVSARD